MRINTNTTALNSYNQLKQTDNMMQKSLERLSSGKRINQAADDAAGLAISEKMNSQIRGLNQSARNIQDSISMVQTAEGGLKEVHALLQRGRELSVQAANGSNTEADREEIQAEIDQIKDEVTKIANSTQFNNKDLLNKTSANADLQETIIDKLKDGWLRQGEKLVNDSYGLTATGTDLNVRFSEGAVGGTLALVEQSWSVAGDNASLQDLTLDIELADFEPSTGEHGENSQTTSSSSKVYNDRIIAHEMVHAVMADAMGDDFYDMPTWFKEGTAEFAHGADDRLEADVANHGLSDIVNRAADLVNGASWNGDSRDYSAAYLAVKYIEKEAGGDLGTIIGNINDGDPATDNTINAIVGSTNGDITSKAELVTAIQSGIGANTDGETFYNDDLTIDAGTGTETDTGSILGSDHGGSDLNAEDVSSGLMDGSDDSMNNFTAVYPDSSESEPFKMQIGANGGQTMEIGMASVTAASLSVDDVDVVNDATGAIGKFDAAISSVSSTRSRLGAVQNRLGHALNQNQTSAENLTASNSRIKDADIAEEMMDMSRGRILQQAGTAMLAQANQKPQRVLQLLN